MERIIALIDMDCFYVQVEQRLNPNLVGKPCAVVQYNGWKGGGLIAVSYEARDAGVGRHIRGDEAQKICPEIELVRVPEVNGKADLTKYRDAGKEVIDVISQFAGCVERASVDEAYIDLTIEVQNSLQFEQITLDELENTHVVDWSDDYVNQSILSMEEKEEKRKDGVKKLIEAEDHEIFTLLIGAKIIEKVRAAILEQTGFKCSAGISHNKVLSKLACGIHKPNKQTIIPAKSVPRLFAETSIKKIRNLGGKLGDALLEHGIEMMNDICKYSEKELQKQFGEKNGDWLYHLARGIDHEPVKPRQLPQSIGCSKLFPGKNAIVTIEQVNQWLGILATEIEMRLKKDRTTNNRMATLLCLHVNFKDDNPPLSRSCPLSFISSDKIASSAYQVLAKLNKSTDNCSWSPAITSLGMSATKFKNIESASATLMKSYFQPRSDNTGRNHIEIEKSNSHHVESEVSNVSVPKQSYFSQKKPESLNSPAKSTTSTNVEIQELGVIRMKNVPTTYNSDSIENSDQKVCNDLSDDVSTLLSIVGETQTSKTIGGACGIETYFPLQKKDDQYLCEKCQNLVSVWNQMEHEDFHFAKEIQATFKVERSSSNTVSRSLQPPKTSKRKSSKRHKNEPKVKTRSISSYFKTREPKNDEQ